jgi:tetratricopeptide (TPR) repeat protein
VHVDVANSYSNLAGLEYSRGRHREAEQQYAAAVEIAQRAGDSAAAASIQLGLGVAYTGQGRLQEAIITFEKASQVMRSNYGLEHSTTRHAFSNLAFTYLRAGRAAEAEPVQRDLLGATERMVGRRHSDWAGVAYSLGNTLNELGRFDEAAEMMRPSLETYRANLPAMHPPIGSALTDLGSVEFERKQYATAEKLHREAMRIFEGTKADRSPVAKTYYGLAEVFEATGRLEDAITYMRMDLVMLRELKVADAGVLAYPELALGRVLLLVRRLDDAEPLIREGLQHAQTSLPAEHWRLAEARAIQGAYLRRRGRIDEARSLLQTSVDDLRRLRPGRRELSYAELELAALR